MYPEIKCSSLTDARRLTKSRLATRGKRFAEEVCLAAPGAQHLRYSVFRRAEFGALNAHASRLLQAPERARDTNSQTRSLVQRVEDG